MTTLALSERETADLELRHKKSGISIKYTVPHKETHCDGALWHSFFTLWDSARCSRICRSVYSDYSIIIIPLMRIICKSVYFFCLLIIKNTLILAHVWSAWPAVSLLLADAVCIKSSGFLSKHKVFCFSNSNCVAQTRARGWWNTRVIHEDEATISAEECQGHLRDMPVIKDFYKKFTVWSVWQTNKTTSEFSCTFFPTVCSKQILFKGILLFFFLISVVLVLN